MIVALGLMVFIPMLVEAAVAGRHDRLLRAQGAIEPIGDVYRLMQVVYPGAFLAMMLEAWLRHGRSNPALLAGIVVFVLSKGLKYWAIATLGNRWTFRVLVPPGSRRIVEGPYRVLRHPNYIAVIGELGGLAMMANARITGPVVTVLFLLLIRARTRVEERALAAR